MDQKIGSVTHYYSNINVGTIKLDGDLKVGDKVKFKGNTTDFDQEITEMQFNHEGVESASAGQEIGVKVSEKVRTGDEVFLA